MTLDLSTMNKLKQDRLTDVLQTPDMGLFMISTPELERLIVHNNHNNTVLTTPTPTGQILFPKMVTEEQEAYARGFIDALGELHKNNKPQQPQQQQQSQLQQQSQQQQQRPQSQPQQSVIKQQTPQLQNAVTSSTATSTATSSFIPTTFNNILTYNNNTTNFDPIIENEIIFSEPLNMKTMNPTTVSNMFDYNNNISTMNNYSNNNNVIVTSNINTMLKPAINPLSTTTSSMMNNNHNNTKLMYNNPMIQQLQQKEIYQTVPHSPANSKNTSSSSSSSSSPNHYAQTSQQISPINMDVQEVAKLERKRARNRIAATRCRNRKLERIARLEERVKELKDQNLNLAQSASLLREQVFKLKQTIVEHTQRGCQVMLTSKFLDSNTTMFS